jgi:TrpR-related protein YerC/YecD
MKNHLNVSSSQEALAERNLFAAIASLRSADECRAFFRDLCTPAEIQAMADRWAVVDWLMRGVPYREINRLTGVSVTTISRVARCLADGNGGYSLVVRRTGSARRNDSARRVEAARHG